MDKLLFFSTKSTQQTVPSLTGKDTDYTFTSDIRHHRRKKKHLEFYIYNRPHLQQSQSDIQTVNYFSLQNPDKNTHLHSTGAHTKTF